MTSHSTDPLVRQTTIRLLDDKSNYVKKTALFSIIKLANACSEWVEESGIIDRLYNMLKNQDSGLLSAVVHVLNELMANSGGMVVNNKILIYLLNR